MPKMKDFLDNIDKRSKQGAAIGGVLGGMVQKTADVFPVPSVVVKSIVKAGGVAVTWTGAGIGAVCGAVVGVVETVVDGNCEHKKNDQKEGT